MIGHVSQGDENGEETKNMEDQDHALKSRKNFAANTVDGDSKYHNSPEYKRSMPSLGLIFTVREHDQALNQGADQIA